MAVVEPGYLVAHALDLVNGVADQNDRRAAGQQLGHALLTLLLKQEVLVFDILLILPQFL